MRRQIVPALRIFAVLTVLCGLLYPLAVTGIAQAAFGDRADGSLIRNADGFVVGSSLLGQAFDGDEWFQPRPSAAGDGYDATASGSTNLGPTNEILLASVTERISVYREQNGLGSSDEVPVDAVTASGSGLDPHISVANAEIQAPRVAAARGLPVDEVLDLVVVHTDGRPLGFLGEPAVNVVTLNVALADRT